MNKKSRHVIANMVGGWSVRRYGARRATRRFDTEAEAVRFARQMARREQTRLVLHRSDGMVRKMETYDPNDEL